MCLSKEWVNLNPRNDPNSMDLYYNERLNTFSLSPIFEKAALPELYEMFSRNFKLKLKLPFLSSHPDFIEECSKLNTIDQKLEKPLGLEQYVESDVFLKRLALVLDANYDQEQLTSKENGKGIGVKNKRVMNLTKENRQKEVGERGSEPTIEKEMSPVLKASNFKENTLKIRKRSEKRPLKTKQIADIPVISLQNSLQNFKQYLCGNNVTIADFQKFRIEDKEALRNFFVVNKNDVALFYEIFQRVHKIKPIFAYITMPPDKKTLGKLTLDGKPMLQVYDTCKKDAKKVLCSIALEIFCPLIKNYQTSMKRKSHQVKGLMDPNLRPKKKKVKGSNEEESAQCEQDKKTDDEKMKNPEEFMKGFENINKILGKSNELDPPFEQKESLETLDNEPMFDEDEQFNLFMKNMFLENNTYDLNAGLFEDPMKYREKELGEIQFFPNNNNIYEQNQKGVNNQSGSSNLAPNQLFPNFLPGQLNFTNNNHIKNNVNMIPHYNSQFQNPKKNNSSFTKPHQIPQNHKNDKQKTSFQGQSQSKNENIKIIEKEKNLFDKELIKNKKPSNEREKSKEKDIEYHMHPEREEKAANDSNKEEEELEEELKRLCGKKIISIDDLLKDMGSSQKNYPITLAIEFLEKLLKFYSLKHHENNKIFTIKNKDIIRVSIKRNEKGEVCFVRNESPSLAKYFCLIDFFKSKYSPKSTVNEILVKLLKKNIQKPPPMTTTTFNKPTREEKIPSSEVRGLIDDIESFQYSRNTINNKRKDEENDCDLNDENELEEESIKKKPEENYKKHEENKNRKESLNEGRMNSSSQRDKEKRKNDEFIKPKGKEFEERRRSKSKDDKELSDENDIIFIE